MSRWWRAYDEAVDDPKLGLLTDRQHRAWFNLVCISSQNGGTLPAMPAVAFKLKLSIDKARSIVAELVTLKLFDLDSETGVCAPHNWKGRQFQSDVSTTRVKRFRERERNVSVTPPDTDTDTEQIQRQKTPPLPPLPTASEYPETAAAVREKDPACDDLFVRRLVATTVQAALSDPAVPDGEVDKITDAIMADAVRESFKTFNGRRQHGTGLLLSRVPQIVKNWCKEPDE